MDRRLLIGVLFAVAVYAGIALWVDFDALKDALFAIPWWSVPAALGLALSNYLLRFLKWERYRRLLGIDVDLKTSFLVYMSGFSMGITPGKMGEVLKSWMLRKVCGVRIHASAPIVVAERLTDLFAYLILVAIGGIFQHPEYRWVFWAGIGACVAAVLLAGSPRFAALTTAVAARLPLVRRYAHKIEGAFQSSRVLLSPRETVFPTLLSVVSWGCECAGFWVLANAFCEQPISFLFSVFAYAVSALIGALAIFLPGGIGATEWSLGTILRREYEVVAGYGLELARTKAAGAVLLTRFCTLWFAVGLGFLATAGFERLHGRVPHSTKDLAAARDEP